MGLLSEAPKVGAIFCVPAQYSPECSPVVWDTSSVPPSQSWRPPLVAPCAQRGGLGGPRQGQLCPRSLTVISSNNVPKRCHHTWKITYPFPHLKKQYVRGSFQLYVFSGWWTGLGGEAARRQTVEGCAGTWKTPRFLPEAKAFRASAHEPAVLSFQETTSTSILNVW